MSYAKCGVCKKKYVPEVLLTTIDPPPELETVGNGILLEAHGLLTFGASTSAFVH